MCGDPDDAARHRGGAADRRGLLVDRHRGAVDGGRQRRGQARAARAEHDDVDFAGPIVADHAAQSFPSQLRMSDSSSAAAMTASRPLEQHVLAVRDEVDAGRRRGRQPVHRHRQAVGVRLDLAVRDHPTVLAGERDQITLARARRHAGQQCDARRPRARADSGCPRGMTADRRRRVGTITAMATC